MTENENPGFAHQPPSPAEPVTAAPAQPIWAGTEPPQASWYSAPAAPTTTVAPPPQQRPGRFVAAGLLGLLLAAGGGAIGGVVVHAADTAHTTSTTSASNTTPTSVKVIDRSSLADIAAVIKPSVVSIQVPGAEGSGVVFNSNGYVVTNNHVVSGARGNTVQVIFSDGKSATATIVGTDPKTDLAVVKVSGVSGLVPAKFGDSSTLRVGDTVLAIGSPLGLEGSVTSGIVSALNRTISEGSQNGNPFQSQQQQQSTDIGGAVQTDAAINPGNSGGALVDLNAAVVGINTAIATSGSSDGNIGVGFAIPGNLVKQVAQDLIGGKKVSHPYLGVGVTTADNNGGATVNAVTSGGPAAKAGLTAGDVITKVGATNIHTSEDLVTAIQSSGVGDKLDLTVVRGGKQLAVTVTVGEAS
jgi:putative serine protease PepD